MMISAAPASGRVLVTNWGIRCGSENKSFEPVHISWLELSEHATPLSLQEAVKVAASEHAKKRQLMEKQQHRGSASLSSSGKGGKGGGNNSADSYFKIEQIVQAFENSKPNQKQSTFVALIESWVTFLLESRVSWHGISSNPFSVDEFRRLYRKSEFTDVNVELWSDLSAAKRSAILSTLTKTPHSASGAGKKNRDSEQTEDQGENKMNNNAIAQISYHLLLENLLYIPITKTSFLLFTMEGLWLYHKDHDNIFKKWSQVFATHIQRYGTSTRVAPGLLVTFSAFGFFANAGAVRRLLSKMKEKFGVFPTNLSKFLQPKRRTSSGHGRHAESRSSGVISTQQLPPRTPSMSSFSSVTPSSSTSSLSDLHNSSTFDDLSSSFSEMTTTNMPRRSIASKGKEKEEEEEPEECCVCQCEPKSHALVPCGHKCVCKECAEEVMKKLKKCPLCRQEVVTFIHIYE